MGRPLRDLLLLAVVGCYAAVIGIRYVVGFSLGLPISFHPWLCVLFWALRWGSLSIPWSFSLVTL
jgi:hypothetical protein